MYKECPECHGKDDECPVCKGHGIVDENNLPPMVESEIEKVHEDELNK